MLSLMWGDSSRTGFIFIWGVSLTHPTLTLIFCGDFFFFFLGGGGGGGGGI